MFIIDVLVLAVTCSLVTVNCSSVKSNLQYDHSFDPRAHKNPGKTEYHIDLDSLIEEALTSETELRKLYNHYKAKHGVSHGQHETAERLKLFRQYLVRVQELKRDDSITWTPGITLMAHMTDCEKSLMTSGNITLDTDDSEEELCGKFKNRVNKKESNVLQGSKIPESYDWRAVGAVTPVKEQGESDCWAYAAVTSMEAQIKYWTGVLLELSTQELVDCVYYGTGPDSWLIGGQPYQAWAYVYKTNRIGYRAEIPVRAEGGYYSCSYEKWAHNALADNNLRMTPVEFLRRKQATAQNIMFVVSTTTPVAVLIATQYGDLDKYKGGPFDPRTSKCKPNTKTNHAVVIVGYDKDYFYIKNSWGDQWGNDGYLWWVRKQGVRDCGIYSRISYHMMAKTKTLKKE